MKKIIIIVLAFLVMAFIATGYFTNQAQWVGIRQTDDHDEESAVIITDNYPQYDIEPNFGVISESYDSTETRIYSLAEYNNRLYAGTYPGGKIYEFDGATWRTSYDSAKGHIYSLAEYKGTFYAGSDGNVYEYNGTGWSLTQGIRNNIYALKVYNEELYAGAYNGKVYSYDATTWSTSYSSTETYVYSLETYKNKLYAGTGNETGNGGQIYEYDGTTWSLSYDSTETAIYSMEIYNDKLYAGGYPNGTVYEYDGTTWSTSYDSGFLNQSIRSLGAYNNKLYASTAPNGTVYKYDGTSWSVLAYIPDGENIYASEKYNGKFYLGTGGSGIIYSYHILPRQEVTIENTDPISVNITEAVALKTNATIKNIPLPVNITNYGMKEYTATIVSNGTNKSDIVFNGLLEHLIIQPNRSSATWRYKLTDQDSFIIYDGTDIDQTGRLGLIVDLPLIGQINTTIQNASGNDNFSIKIVYT